MRNNASAAAAHRASGSARIRVRRRGAVASRAVPAGAGRVRVDDIERISLEVREDGQLQHHRNRNE
jgi:hypothetical protein